MTKKLTSRVKKKKFFLSSIFIENYKNLKNSNHIHFRSKINLIFGKNSTGKSSILQALRLFRQSLDKGQQTPLSWKIPEKFRDRGGINFEGDFKEVVSDGNIKKD